jgi:hypothetical protein
MTVSIERADVNDLSIAARAGRQERLAPGGVERPPRDDIGDAR